MDVCDLNHGGGGMCVCGEGQKTLFQSPVPNELMQKMIAEFEKIKAGY